MPKNMHNNMSKNKHNNTNNAPNTRKRLVNINLGLTVCLLLISSGCALRTQTNNPPPYKLKSAKIESAQSNKAAEINIHTWIQQLKSNNKATRDQARESLIKVGSPLIPTLANILDSTNDFSSCWEAVNIMGYIGDAKASPYLVEQALKSTNNHVRWRSIWALNRMPREKILPPLLKALGDKDERIKWNAAVALAVFNRVEAVPVLKGGLSNHSSWIQWEAINALGQVYDQETVPALLSLLKCPLCISRDNRKEAILSLGKIGDSRAIPALSRALKDPSQAIRWRAALALQNIGDVTALSALEKCLETEQDEMVKKSVKEAINKLKKQQIKKHSTTSTPSSGQGKISFRKGKGL